MNDPILQLRSALPYIRRYQRAVFVIKLGGEMFTPEVLDRIAEQVAVLYHVGILPVLVHGGGPQVDSLIRERGGEIRKVNGRRITDEASLEALIMVVAGRLNMDLVSALSRHGLSAVGLTGLDGSTVSAARRPPVTLVDQEDGQEKTVDFGLVGDVEAIDPGLIRHMLDGGYTPVLACVAGDPDKSPLNVNADTFSMTLAVELGAGKLIYLVDVPGLLRDPGDPSSLVSYADPSDIDEMIGAGGIKGGMLPKVDACVKAVTGGVDRAHMVHGTRSDALLAEIFTNRGSGTMIVSRREGINETEL